MVPFFGLLANAQFVVEPGDEWLSPCSVFRGRFRFPRRSRFELRFITEHAFVQRLPFISCIFGDELPNRVFFDTFDPEVLEHPLADIDEFFLRSLLGAIREEPLLLALLAPANATATGNGDAGLAVFDIESASARLLPTPEGFANVQILAIFDTTRKVIARGNRAANAGSSLLVYDLVSGDLYLPPNPEGCAFVGTVPAAGGGGGGAQQALNLLAANPKANSVIAGCFGANRQLVGFVNLKSN